MRIRWDVFASLALWATGEGQQAPPAITPGSIVNAASLMPASLPGGVLPRGGLVALFGPRLRAEKVTIRASGLAFEAAQVFQADEYLTVLLPADLPAGDAQLSLTYQGQRSVDHPVQLATYGPRRLRRARKRCCLPPISSPSDVFESLNPKRCESNTESAFCTQRSTNRTTMTHEVQFNVKND